MIFSRNNIQKRDAERGFTLVEPFVAVALLMVALVGPLTLAQQSLSTATYSADQVTAFYLAQDAMEYIRNVRDSNVKSGQPWLTGLTSLSCYTGSGACQVDTSYSQPVTSAFSDCFGSCAILQYNASNNKYGYASGTASPFRRSIYIDVIDATREIIVNVEVEWTSNKGRVTNSFTATQSLFNFGS